MIQRKRVGMLISGMPEIKGISLLIAAKTLTIFISTKDIAMKNFVKLADKNTGKKDCEA